MMTNVFNTMNAHKGFTLIELLITLILGMLISAAVIQVFVTTQRVDSIQRGGSEIQDKSLFGMQAIESQVRLANLGNDGQPMNAITPRGGIVLTAEDYSAIVSGGGGATGESTAQVNVSVNGGLPDGYLTRSGTMTNGGSNGWNGSNVNTNVPSDQLTIQYTNDISITNSSGKITDRHLYNCEGTEVLKGETVIERYYVGKFSEPDKDDKFHLICDAGIISAKTLTGLGTDAVVIMENVDQFNIRLGVARGNIIANQPITEYADMTVEEYMDMGASNLGDTPFITNIRIAILASSSTATANVTKTEDPVVYRIFGEDQTLTAGAYQNYMRRLYETNILLRNGRMIQVTDLGSSSTKL